jgi:hypothetical protein
MYVIYGPTVVPGRKYPCGHLRVQRGQVVFDTRLSAPVSGRSAAKGEEIFWSLPKDTYSDTGLGSYLAHQKRAIWNHPIDVHKGILVPRCVRQLVDSTRKSCWLDFSESQEREILQSNLPPIKGYGAVPCPL